MSTILSFNEFAKDNILNDPKKHALKADGEDHLKKEKFVDQVKHAELSQDLEVNEPDYTKTVDGKKIDEAADVASIMTAMTSLNTAQQAANQKVTAAETALTTAKSELDKINTQIEAQKIALETAKAASQGTSGTAAPATQAPAPAAPIAAPAAAPAPAATK